MPRKRITTNTLTATINLHDLFNQYVLDKGVTCTATTTTQLKYKILPFIQWCGDKPITQQTINDYMLYLNSSYSNTVTINSYLKHIRAFINWCFDNDFIPTTPIKYHIKNNYQANKECYTDHELQLLLTKPSTNNFTDIRNWCIVNFFIGTGCRINTLINVRICDISFASATITFNVTKNKKMQVVPLSTTLAKVLRIYLNSWVHTDNDYLFPNQYGDKLSNNSVTHAIAKYNKKRGVSKTSCHLFRHTFAHNYLLANGDIFRLQALLGHSTLDMVRIYANMNNIDSLKHNYDKLNLLDTLKATKNKIHSSKN